MSGVRPREPSGTEILRRLRHPAQQSVQRLRRDQPSRAEILWRVRSALAGAPAPAPSRPAEAGSRFSSSDLYTPRHLVERILTSKTAVEGERKQVTVLFADMKGSMELLADRDPEEARKILDPVLERMMEAVHRYEGTVNQVMGDGIMALFGAPLAHEDHAVRACYAALRGPPRSARGCRPRGREGSRASSAAMRRCPDVGRLALASMREEDRTAILAPEIIPPRCTAR